MVFLREEIGQLGGHPVVDRHGNHLTVSHGDAGYCISSSKELCNRIRYCLAMVLLFSFSALMCVCIQVFADSPEIREM